MILLAAGMVFTGVNTGVNLVDAHPPQPVWTTIAGHTSVRRTAAGPNQGNGIRGGARVVIPFWANINVVGEWTWWRLLDC